MKSSELNKLAVEVFQKCEEVIREKGKFYGQSSDRLNQLKKIAELNNENPLKATYGLVSKHFVALGEMCEKEKNFTEEDFDAYLYDIIVYSVLIKAIIRDE